MNGEDDATVWPELGRSACVHRLPVATWNSSFATARPLVLDDHRLILAVRSLHRKRTHRKPVSRSHCRRAVGSDRPADDGLHRGSRGRRRRCTHVRARPASHPRRRSPTPVTTAAPQLPFGNSASEQVSGDLVLNPSLYRSPTSLSGHPTGSRTPRPCRWPRRPPVRTTRCSSTATPGSGRPTCCRRLPITCGRITGPVVSVTYRPKRS